MQNIIGSDPLRTNPVSVIVQQQNESPSIPVQQVQQPDSSTANSMSSAQSMSSPHHLSRTELEEMEDKSIASQVQGRGSYHDLYGSAKRIGQYAHEDLCNRNRTDRYKKIKENALQEFTRISSDETLHPEVRLTASMLSRLLRCNEYGTPPKITPDEQQFEHAMLRLIVIPQDPSSKLLDSEDQEAIREYHKKRLCWGILRRTLTFNEEGSIVADFLSRMYYFMYFVDKASKEELIKELIKSEYFTQHKKLLLNNICSAKEILAIFPFYLRSFGQEGKALLFDIFSNLKASIYIELVKDLDRYVKDQEYKDKILLAKAQDPSFSIYEAWDLAKEISQDCIEKTELLRKLREQAESIILTQEPNDQVRLLRFFEGSNKTYGFCLPLAESWVQKYPFSSHWLTILSLSDDTKKEKIIKMLIVSNSLSDYFLVERIKENFEEGSEENEYLRSFMTYNRLSETFFESKKDKNYTTEEKVRILSIAKAIDEQDLSLNLEMLEDIRPRYTALFEAIAKAMDEQKLLDLEAKDADSEREALLLTIAGESTVHRYYLLKALKLLPNSPGKKAILFDFIKRENEENYRSQAVEILEECLS